MQFTYKACGKQQKSTIIAIIEKRTKNKKHTKCANRVFMNILISNDDGYMAVGIRKLAKRLCREHNVVVIAPTGERSGSSHAVNFFSGIRYADMGEIDGIRTFSVDGTPADCVLFGVKYLCKDTKFDLVLSGINTCMNAGSDIIYSGTFGAAQEGTFNGIAGIAVSVRAKGSEEYEFTADFIARNLETLKSFAKENVTINVNVPSVHKCDINGVKIAPIAFQQYNEQYVRTLTDDGKEVFFVDGHPQKQKDEQSGGDCYQLEQGYITITPVQLLCTDIPTLEEMKKVEFEL